MVSARSRGHMGAPLRRSPPDLEFRALPTVEVLSWLSEGFGPGAPRPAVDVRRHGSAVVDMRWGLMCALRGVRAVVISRRPAIENGCQRNPKAGILVRELSSDRFAKVRKASHRLVIEAMYES